jgi:hypothetical protein
LHVPVVFATVSNRSVKSRTVANALPENAWIRDISGTLSVEGVGNFLHLVDIFAEQQIVPDSEDKITWSLSTSRITTPYGAASEVQNLDRCWTVKSRMRHGLDDDDTYALCDKEIELISHLLTQCSFSQQIWQDVLTRLNLQTCIPNSDEDFCFWFQAAMPTWNLHFREELNQSSYVTTPLPL